MVSLVGQILSLGAMGCNVYSFQRNKKRELVLCQFVGSGLFALSYLLTGGYSAFLQNVVATTRNAIFSRRELSEKATKIWSAVFIGLFLVAYGLTFWLFDVEFTPKNAVVEALPTVAMCIMGVAFSFKSVFRIRILAIVNAFFWLAYSLIHPNIGDIISELLCIGSSLIAIFRYDLKKTEKH